MQFCVHIQLEFEVCIPCHNYCASLLWFKPLYDMPPPHFTNKPTKPWAKNMSPRTQAERIVWSTCQIRGFFCCLECNFSCYPSYSKASLVSSFFFLSLLHLFWGSSCKFLQEHTLMNKWMNSFRKIKLTWHGAAVLNMPESHTWLIMFYFVQFVSPHTCMYRMYESI